MTETKLARMSSFEFYAELSESNQHLLEQNGYFKKKYATLTQEAETSQNMYSRLETQLFTYDSQLEELRKENSILLRRLKEIEKESEMEKTELERERLSASEKMATLQTQLRKLKMRSAPPPSRIPPPVDFRRDELSVDVTEVAKENTLLTKTVKNQERLIAELREEIDKSQQAVQSSTSRLQECSLQIASLENEKLQIRGVNQTLMEENESYQVLLQEKTMSGKFMLNPILQNRNALIEEDEGLSSLAREILSVPTSPITPDFDTTYTIERLKDDVGTFRDENRVLKDENKALTLYINKILIRILESGGMENVLSSDYTTPTQPKEDESLPVEKLTVQTRVSLEEEESYEGQEQCTRTRRSNSLSQSLLTTGNGVAGGFRAAWKRMSVGTWKSSPITSPNCDSSSPEE
ncbi:hypothetical protein K493DRAFT_309079 [Basidiobolus meristosporus CBS 931.73]|uniref:Uncharacterized protein n=1 Tax=Basidiobolus meristosporus CBS 931.73 TaxID=1314790 RepID=A0A1Y1WRB6_9FUNG|nr:hypothetical protein K493DRAFT_309079 [Basidiobolus meristosporus CBS 931.73]|eukprot:ORX76070.1 hypothetical protein K493DRAFT_309079 [Basidiobolus meristosporus CBS 931.73]